MIDVALMLPELSGVPETVTKSPWAMSLKAPTTVFSIVVLELIITVACPCDVVSVNVLPLIDAKVPFAPRRWNWEVCVVVGDVDITPVAAVVAKVVGGVVCEDADEHATVTTDTTTAKVIPALSGIMFLRFIFMITSFLCNLKNLML
jgi:hypothetical protein